MRKWKISAITKTFFEFLIGAIGSFIIGICLPLPIMSILVSANFLRPSETPANYYLSALFSILGLSIGSLLAVSICRVCYKKTVTKGGCFGGGIFSLVIVAIFWGTNELILSNLVIHGRAFYDYFPTGPSTFVFLVPLFSTSGTLIGFACSNWLSMRRMGREK